MPIPQSDLEARALLIKTLFTIHGLCDAAIFSGVPLDLEDVQERIEEAVMRADDAAGSWGVAP